MQLYFNISPLMPSTLSPLMRSTIRYVPPQRLPVSSVGSDRQPPYTCVLNPIMCPFCWWTFSYAALVDSGIFRPQFKFSLPRAIYALLQITSPERGQMAIMQQWDECWPGWWLLCCVLKVCCLCFRMPAATPPAEPNGAPRSELEQLQMRAGQVTDEVSIYNKENIS